jgi:D-alanyl-D-alanine carboxypeptidase
VTSARTAGTLLAIATLCCAGCARANDKTVVAQIQQTLDDYVTQRAPIEGITGVSLHIDLGDPGPIIEAFSGNDGLPDNAPIDSDTLFQIGSNTKHFTAALVLKLEAEGKLNINQTVGDWLPKYRAWSGVTIRQLLNMTSDIPNYTETVAIGEIIAADIHHQFTKRELVARSYRVQPTNCPFPPAGSIRTPTTSWRRSSSRRRRD